MDILFKATNMYSNLSKDLDAVRALQPISSALYVTLYLWNTDNTAKKVTELSKTGTTTIRLRYSRREASQTEYPTVADQLQRRHSCDNKLFQSLVRIVRRSVRLHYDESLVFMGEIIFTDGYDSMSMCNFILNPIKPHGTFVVFSSTTPYEANSVVNKIIIQTGCRE